MKITEHHTTRHTLHTLVNIILSTMFPMQQHIWKNLKTKKQEVANGHQRDQHPTSMNQIEDAVIHGPPHPPRQLSEVSGPVLAEEGGVSVSDVLFGSDDSKEVAERHVSVYTADSLAVHRADAVVASVLVGIVQE